MQLGPITFLSLISGTLRVEHPDINGPTGDTTALHVIKYVDNLTVVETRQAPVQLVQGCLMPLGSLMEWSTGTKCI